MNTAWFALAGLTLVLLLSAVYKKNHKSCEGIEVTFKGDGNNFFIEEKGVIGLLKANGLVIGQPIETIDLKSLEETLKRDKWIANAELFFDNNQVLRVKVEEKTPVARIFTVGGSSFYIDSACRKLPLSEKLSARIPMITNFPSDKSRLSKPDSELLASVKQLAMFIQADDFWKAQVAQVDITPDGFEIVPTVGNHVIVLGDGDELQQKFDKLFSFYKQVWTKVGFEKYEKIDVRFAGQVVATIKGTKTAIVDSAKVRKAYEKLVAETKTAAEDSKPVSVAQSDEPVEVAAKARTISKTDAVRGRVVQAAKKEPARRHVLKGSTTKQHVAATKKTKQIAPNKQVANNRVPKALMKKKVS
jgi:cell division protein FtsQ